MGATLPSVFLSRFSSERVVPYNKAMDLAVIFNLLGLTLLFVGNAFVTYTVGKWGGRNMKQFQIGNTLQAIGFIISLLAIFASVNN